MVNEVNQCRETHYPVTKQSETNLGLTIISTVLHTFVDSVRACIYFMVGKGQVVNKGHIEKKI